MPDVVLTILKYVFLAVLYLFFVRVIRAVWVELREPKPGTVPEAAPEPQHAPAAQVPRSQPASAAHDGGGAKLVVLEPPERRGQAFDLGALGEELTVGRAPGCGIALAYDSFVSHLHARLFRHDGTFYIEDLGSTNGTFVNAQKIAAAVPLQRGDKLQIGKTTLELST